MSNQISTSIIKRNTGLLLFSATAICINALRMYRRTSSTTSTSSLASNSCEKTLSNVDYWAKRDGEHAYLEEVLGDDALKFVYERNKHAITSLGDPSKTPIYDRFLSILDNKDKIPYVSKIGDKYYNFWQDGQHVKGIWRRTTLMSYRSEDTTWETVLDIDELGSIEKENWVYKGNYVHHPDDDSDPTRVLMLLSRGGADATVVREFDLVSLKFIDTSDGGFNLPEAKSRISWKDINTLIVGTDMKDNNSMTLSGYPRVVREWTRGTSIKQSKIIFEGDVNDVSCAGYFMRHRHFNVQVNEQSMTFYTSIYNVMLPNSSEFVQLQVPIDCEIGQFKDQLLIKLRSDWIGYTAGSLLSVPWMSFMEVGVKASFTVLFTPSARVSLDSYHRTKNYLIIHTLDNVKSRLYFCKYNGEDSKWAMKHGYEDEAIIRGASISSVDSDNNDFYWLTTSSFIKPSTLYLGDASLKGTDSVTNAKKVKATPDLFNNNGLVELQFEAISEDGTSIPYFMIHRRDIKYDGTNPTLVYGYGGFEISLLPAYGAITGAGWLENGGIYVSANIRGGGEFGPTYHQAALRENRKLAYDDFIAVVKDVIAKKITSSSRVGIRGGSNGGLLMGNMINREPTLFGAVCCAVPLLDMKIYHRLLAGASWVGEYGCSETGDEWSFLSKYSAYHNIDYTTAATTYPPLLMTTSTRDDRVHPYHARSFVKRLLELKDEARHKQSGASAVPDNVYYYENIEGGHGGASNNRDQAYMMALYINFLWSTIGKK